MLVDGLFVPHTVLLILSQGWGFLVRQCTPLFIRLSVSSPLPPTWVLLATPVFPPPPGELDSSSLFEEPPLPSSTQKFVSFPSPNPSSPSPSGRRVHFLSVSPPFLFHRRPQTTPLDYLPLSPGHHVHSGFFGPIFPGPEPRLLILEIKSCILLSKFLQDSSPPNISTTF